jgi:hypothetical protein
VIETSPIAGSVADVTLLYAVMANITYPPSSSADASTNAELNAWLDAESALCSHLAAGAQVF